MEPEEQEDLSSTSRGEPRRAEPHAELERGAARGAKPPLGAASSAARGAPRGDVSRRYTPAQKQAVVDAFAQASAAGETMQDFCAREGLSTASLCKWRKLLRLQGASGLAPRPNARNAEGPHRGAASYTPEQRRAAVEAYLVAGQTLKDFARLWGVSSNTLAAWVKRHRTSGPQGLEPRVGRPRGATPAASSSSSIGRRLAQPVRELIARVRGNYPYFGLKRIRDVLLRFHAIRVSTGGVKSALQAAGLPAALPRERRRRRAAPKVRSFERAAPMQLWQTDITSFLLGRQRERAYLTVFLDDMSRFVVSFALHLQQKSELVLEALKDGIARFGKPKEVLTDQGRQYFAWRGKSEFQRFLHREGIAHVIARAHHPQTVGKCERLWETVQAELLSRVEIESLEDGRTRLKHFFRHYNFSRPHQGIDGLVPADRFFRVEDSLRAALEQQLATNELALALEQTPPPAVFLFGQIGDEQVAVHGERGRVVIATSRGERHSLAAERVEHERGSVSGVQSSESSASSESAVRIPWKSGEEQSDERAGSPVEPGRCDDERGAAAAAPLPQAADQDGAADAGAGEGAVGAGERSGEDAGAPCLRGDPADVAREGLSDRGSARALAHAAATMAALPAGGRGDDRGSFEAAALAAAEGSAGDGARSSRGSEAAAAADPRARAGAQDRERREPAAAGVSGAPRRDEGERVDGSERGDGDGERERGGERRRPEAQEEAPRDAQIDCARKLGSESGAG